MPTRYSQDEPFLKERIALGRSVEKLRRERGLTQEKLAENSAINVSYLAKIENGYVNTTVRYLVKIAKGLRVRVKDLFEF